MIDIYIKDGLEERVRPGKMLLLLSIWEVRCFWSSFLRDTYLMRHLWKGTVYIYLPLKLDE